MKFFLDTADINEIKEAASWGILDGVTTNPSHVARTGRTFREVLCEIVQIVPGPVSAEVTAVDLDGMLRQGRDYAGLASNIVIKIPLIETYLKLVKHPLTDSGLQKFLDDWKKVPQDQQPEGGA